MDEIEQTRRSWNAATANHNAHKGDQARWLREGGDTLFAEELELLGPLQGRRLVHLQCNAGQDTLCLARRGAVVTGVDLSDTAIDFARALAVDSGLPGRFVRAEVLQWLATTDERFEVAFASYGALGWIRDLAGWMRGAARVLEPGGRLVVLEFHPMVWSLGEDLQLSGDDYFARTPWQEPVFDYVATSVGEGDVEPLPNGIPATSWQHTTAQVLQALLDAGLQLERVREYPSANFARVSAGLVRQPGRRWGMPVGKPRVPMMLGLTAVKPGA